MNLNIILAGVGGQGILSIAWVLDHAALEAGFQFKQAEVHGMSQRGGAVQSHLRISDGTIRSDLIPEGCADLVLSVEPLESLRYSHFLKPSGTVVTSSAAFVNIPNYPDMAEVMGHIGEVPHHVVVNAEALAKLAGSPRAQNMVMLGAASPLLPFSADTLIAFIQRLFRRKSDRLVRINEAAFQLGRRMGAFFIAAQEAGITDTQLRALCDAADPEAIELGALPAWSQALKAKPSLLNDAPAHSLAITKAAAAQAMSQQ